MRIIGILLLTTVISGCSSAASAPPAAEIVSIEAFLSRAALNRTDFEQYKLSGATLFGECGRIHRGRFLAETQDIYSLEAPAMEGLKQAASRLSASIAEYKPEFDPPGSNSSMFDPGQINLALDMSDGSRVVQTSLDSISKASSGPEQDLQHLLTLLRGSTGKAPCGNREFYGLGME